MNKVIVIKPSQQVDPIQFQIRIQHFRRKQTTQKCRNVYTGIKDDQIPNKTVSITVIN
jgi:hypothetical protein